MNLFLTFIVGLGGGLILRLFGYSRKTSMLIATPAGGPATWP